MSERDILLEILDPRGLVPEYKTCPIAHLYFELSKLDTNEPIRDPDPVYSDTLLPARRPSFGIPRNPELDFSRAPRRNKPLSEEDKRITRKMYEEEQRIEEELLQQENELLIQEDLLRKYTIISENMPDDFDKTEIKSLLDSLQRYDYIDARRLLAQFKDMKHIMWIKKLTITNVNHSFEINLKDKSPNAILIIETLIRHLN